MKKVLIVTYYWPPAGGISLHRCLKFAKYLPSFGWEPVVYTAKDAQYPYFDESNFKDIPEGITILKQPIVEPFDLFKKISGRKKGDSLNNVVHVRDRKSKLIDNLGIWVRGNFFIPDARSLWIRPSVKYLTEYLKKNPVDAILSDGPPHTNTAIATQVSQQTGIPFLADFQDPWTQVDYYPLMKLTKWADRKHRKMEQATFNTSKKITIASPTWKSDLENIGAKNVDVLFWGYDEDDFKNLIPQPDTKFSITHAGLLGYDRFPKKLFDALAQLSREIPKFKNDLCIQLIGQVDYEIEKSIQSFELDGNYQPMGQISRDKVLQMLVNSQVLLLLLNQAKNAKGRIPGKLFEYLRAERPSLCLGPTNSDVSAILNHTQSGQTFEYDDTQGIKQFVKQAYHQFKKGNLQLDQKKLENYSVKVQVANLAKYLNTIIEEKGS